MRFFGFFDNLSYRFEGKHREIKAYSNNTCNRINISYSLSKKIQYNFAHRVLTSRGLNDVILATYDPGNIDDKVCLFNFSATFS